MGFTAKPLGCNGKCDNCYEAKVRSVSGPEHIQKMYETLQKVFELNVQERNPTIHGGEPTLLKLSDFGKLLKLCFEKTGQSGIQTNAVKIKEGHIELFKKYKTNIGISIDGDTGMLNRGRWNAEGVTMKDAEIGTASTIENIRRFKDAGLRLSVIILLRTHNASKDRLPDLLKFLDRLVDEFEIIYIRANPVIAFKDYSEQLSPVEYGEAVIAISEWSFNRPGVDIRPVSDVVDLIIGKGQVSCSFRECDPWHTTAERPIFHTGDVGNCMKVAGGQDGILCNQADTYSTERYELLKQIPQDLNGCKDCEWWKYCKGGCPGAGVDGDWRNRTRFCEGYKMIFKHIDNRVRGIINDLPALQKMTTAQCPSGIPGHLDTPHQDTHKDHLDRWIRRRDL